MVVVGFSGKVREPGTASVSNELDVRVRLIGGALDKPNDLFQVNTSLRISAFRYFTSKLVEQFWHLSLIEYGVAPREHES